ncbi:hypothetical protein BS17DRAFT_41743 [Gyrodon lividus]|nr:hypothetical protein BS17DRAFT_41743 [Gyrodon lividus]
MDADESQTQIEHEDHDGKPLNESGDEVASIDSRSLSSHDSHTEYTVVHHPEAVHANPQNNLPLDESTPVTPDRPCLRVHFRSRVRITAGIGRRRRLSDVGLSSNASSISGSPASSISAPLRTHNTASSKGWGPLGSRVSLLASQTAVPQTPGRTVCMDDGVRHGRRKHSRSSCDYGTVDERTRLATSANGGSYTANRSEGDSRQRDSERGRQRREQIVDQAFGKWPGRLLNRHWWWWQLEPIVCCFCLCGDSDEGE